MNKYNPVRGGSVGFVHKEELIARLDGLFASPDFHRTHATETNELMAELAAAKEKLKGIRAGNEK